MKTITKVDLSKGVVPVSLLADVMGKEMDVDSAMRAKRRRRFDCLRPGCNYSTTSL